MATVKQLQELRERLYQNVTARHSTKQHDNQPQVFHSLMIPIIDKSSL
jgi:hypothetical protein